MIARKRLNGIIIALVAILFIAMLKADPLPGMTINSQRSIAIFVVCLILWITSALPLMITSLLAIILFPLTGVLDSSRTYALFGNKSVFFILGAFILASALMRSGLTTRVAVLLLRKCGNSDRQLCLGIFLLCGTVSCFMSEHAVAAMVFPIVIKIVEALSLEPLNSNYSRKLILSMAWGCVIGGITTYLGGARAPLALGILHEITGEKISFLSWSASTIPTVVIVGIIAPLLLNVLLPSRIENIDRARKYLEKECLKLGEISSKEIKLSVLLFLTILAWMFFGTDYGLANIALASVIVAFALNLVEWHEVEEDVNWGIFLMYGGAICLGYAMDKSGGALWLAQNTIIKFVDTPNALIICLCLVSSFLTEGLSNSAVVALLMPIGIELGKKFNLEPQLITFIIAIPSGLAFILPIGTPATAIAYSSGHFSLRDLVVIGIIIKVFAITVLLLSAKFYWPLIGLPAF